MASFVFEQHPFVPVRPRKKRKNKAGDAPTQADRFVALERTMQELREGDWTHECQG